MANPFLANPFLCVVLVVGGGCLFFAVCVVCVGVLLLVWTLLQARAEAVIPRAIGVAETDRRVEEGKRFVASNPDEDSQGASRGMVCGRSTFCNGDPTHGPPRVARLGQRS